MNAAGALPALPVGADTNWIDKPALFPPEHLFGVVWTLRFTLLGITTFLVWKGGTANREVKIALAASAGQFLRNFLWTPVSFARRRPDLGLVVIVALRVVIVGTTLASDRVDRRAAVLLVTSLAWVSSAAVLNYAIYAG